MPRVKKHLASEKDGWTEWISPAMDKSYRLICCDCGLSHNVQFKVFEVKRRLGKGRWVPGKRITGAKILLRVQRNERSTSAIRRAKKK